LPSDSTSRLVMEIACKVILECYKHHYSLFSIMSTSGLVKENCFRVHLHMILRFSSIIWGLLRILSCFLVISPQWIFHFQGSKGFEVSLLGLCEPQLQIGVRPASGPVG
jgi:hypothetical protein